MSQSHEFTAPSERAEKATAQLSDFKKRFDPVLLDFFGKEIERAQALRPELVGFLQVGAEFTAQGGKRLRPAFFFCGYKAAGGAEEEEAIRSSICVELVHTGALIHDDIMDHSDLRRGKPTVHKVLASQLEDEQIGNSIAIIAGDTIFALAGKALFQFPDNERVIAARQLLDEMCLEINHGQCLDVLGNKKDTLDRDWIMKVMELKTAGYTVEKPLLIGALLGGATPEVLYALSRYGKPLGVAFQIQDDILGMFGDEGKVGKPVDSDLKEGKKTLLVLDTFEKLTQEGRVGELERFRNILGNPDLTPEDYKWVQSLMIETGALAYSRELAASLISEAKSAIEGVQIEKESKEYLLGIADFMLKREY